MFLWLSSSCIIFMSALTHKRINIRTCERVFLVLNSFEVKHISVCPLESDFMHGISLQCNSSMKWFALSFIS